jgi:hypothetical protein
MGHFASLALVFLGRNPVLLVQPLAEVKELAALGTKRTIFVPTPLRGLSAVWTGDSHRMRVSPSGSVGKWEWKGVTKITDSWAEVGFRWV